MTQIKPMPVHVREYYKAMKEAYAQKKEKALEERESLISEVDVIQQDIMEHHEDYNKYNINLFDYPEFVNNFYKDGSFLKMCKGAYLNKSNDYTLTADLFNLYKLAEKQHRIYELKVQLELYNKILSIKVNEYTFYLRTFFNEVHKKMIINGYAYRFGNGLGDVIINRVRLHKKTRPRINWAETKKNRAEIIARGGKLYNKEEAEWCEKNGIKYEAEQDLVFLNNEYFYEVFMTNQMYKNAYSCSFTPQDYRSVDVRGKSNAQLIEECDRDLNKICELPVDMKTKLHMCVEVDKMLYTNFIRNEGQTSYKYSEASR